MKKVLVTGADGFIGSHLTEMLVAKGYKVKALSQYNSFNNWGWLENINCKKEVEICSGDIRDLSYCNYISKDIDIIFHLAALVNPQLNEVNPVQSKISNYEATKNLIDAVDSKNCHIIFLSTDKIYGSQVKFSKEDENINPQFLYAKYKLDCENLIQSKLKKFHILRAPIIHGRGSSTSNSIIDEAIREILCGNEFTLYDNVFRSFVEINQLIDILVMLADDASFGIYNIGTDPMSYFKRAQFLLKQINPKLSSKLKSALGNAQPLFQGLDSSKFLSTYNIQFI